MMPISTAAPKTGRDITKRVLLALCVASATFVDAAPALAVSGTPPPIISGPPPGQGQLAYYMMQGSTIISQPYTSAPACQKALTEFKKKLPGNIAPIVCAHRRP
jgi:hypothetical protein